ncbi:Alpha/Beta hydrolase protein [Cytidiella melzeri]|nr:Alpha/Beta hydrolase protein [Cytidiella melzeri]
MGDEGFWVEELFMDELDNLLKVIGLEGGRYDVLGHSWGGMLAMRWAGTRQRQGLRKLVVSCSPASMGLLVEGTVQLRRELPRDIQDALDGHEAAGTTDSAEYRAAEQAFYARHLCRIAPMPEGLVASFEAMSEDPTVYHTMNGPSEFHIVGSLKTWDVRGDLCKICVPTLLLNGRYDEVQDVAVQPLFEGIEKVKWVQFGESSHLPFVEESSRYKQVVAGFLE